MLGIVQAGFGTNFVHFLQNSARHVAWVIEHCEGAGINTIEARRSRRGLVDGALHGGWRHARLLGQLHSQHNSEGNRGPKAARNLTYIGSLLDYDGFLQRWRADAAETASTRRPHDLIGRAGRTPSRPGACSRTSLCKASPKSGQSLGFSR